MKNILLILFLSPILLFAQLIDEDKLLDNIKFLSSDEMLGRRLGSPQNEMAREYIASEFKKVGLKPAFENSFVQPLEYTVSAQYRKRVFKDGVDKDTVLKGANVVAVIKGSSEKVIAITAHLDHLGIKDGEIYNGADDNASGTAALITIGEYFLKNKLNHTLVIAAVDGEEMGMPGSKKLVEEFPGGLDKVVLNVNMDMIAHNDDNEIYACGTFYFPQLKAPLENLHSEVTLLFGHDNQEIKGVQDWTNSSDHRSFYKEDIPFIYFGVEDHKDYHKPTDTFENINKEFYVNAVKLIIQAIEKLDKFI